MVIGNENMSTDDLLSQILFTISFQRQSTMPCIWATKQKSKLLFFHQTHLSIFQD